MADTMKRAAKPQNHWFSEYGPTALITGASDGIGQAFAQHLYEAGFNLVLVARRGEKLRELADQLPKRRSVEIRVVEADLSDDGGVARVFEETRHLEIGLLIACAGFGTSGELIDSPRHLELELIDVNCRAVLALTHTFAQRFVKQRRGGIILMSSIVAFQGVPRAANYAATKAYIQTLAEGLHTELAPYGVDTIACAPGPIHSGFAKRANMQMGLALQPQAVVASTLSALGRRTTVRPGWLSKLLETSLKLPRWARIRIMTVVMKGMTNHQINENTSNR